MAAAFMNKLPATCRKKRANQGHRTSATVTTNWELKTIIENEIGICGLLLVFGSTALHFFQLGSLRLCEKRTDKSFVANKGRRFCIEQDGRMQFGSAG
jgi:hypothetical protein